MEYQEDYLTTSDNLRLLWRSWETSASPRGTLLLIHGLGEHAGRYGHLAQAFNHAGFTVQAFDLRGHGRSEGVRGHTPSFDYWLEDVDLLLQQADPKLPIFLYGHSLGGLIAAVYALRRDEPEISYILSGPGFRRAFEVPAYKIFLAIVLAKLQPTFSQSSGLDPSTLSHDPAVVRAYREDPLVHDWATARLYIEATSAGEWALETADSFVDPLLLVFGAEDRLVDVEAGEHFYHHASSEDKSMRIWPGLYHEIHNETPYEPILEHMVAWVSERS
jgi:alpha-beta hydrolase superfamily lysophospholipase